jgi:FMN phosphatase YigB (HAD superfamily)
MINTILFDLDGTILPLDMDSFMKIYFNEMEKAFDGFEDKEVLGKNVWIATEKMIKSIDDRTNEEVFMENFEKLCAGNLEDYIKIFDKFYDDGFLNTKKAVVNTCGNYIKDSIKLLKDKGYSIVIATNPLFPLKAIHHRIRWSGFDPNEFEYITCYENNHYCKPQIKYYEEILTDIRKKPSDCMMIGNDVQEDMIAGKLGMKTYLINNHIINRNDEEINSDYEGNYEDFYKFVIKLPLVI